MAEKRFRSVRTLKSVDLLNTARKEDESFMETTPDEVKKLCSHLFLTHEQMEKLMNIFNVEVEKGLAVENGSKELRMLNTFVREITTKRIIGEYLALDFKGRYYRVMRVIMYKDSDKSEIDETLYTIPKKIRMESGLEMFKFIAQTFLDFLTIRGIQDREYDLAACFNFPIELRSISEAILISWTKEFSCESVVGQDICALLQSAFNSLNLKITVKAVFNDTVAVLAACASRDHECGIGLVVSAGTNCCYYEKPNMIKRDFAKIGEGQDILINTEWGSFGDAGCIDEFRSHHDRIIDENSMSPGKQIFEKMVSTLYIGELVRLLIVEATEKRLLFNGELPEKLAYTQSFTTQFLFDIDRDPPNVVLSTEVVLRERFKLTVVSRVDLVSIRYICRAVLTRAANLIGAACACLINRMGRKRNTLAVEGSLFRFSTSFPAILVESITQLLPYSHTFKLKLVDDGTGKGAAAIIAAMDRISSQRIKNVLLA